MSSVTVNVEGQGETIRAINMFDMELKKELINLVKSTSRSVGKDARGKVPVGSTGNLKKSIRTKTFDGGLSSTVVPRKPKGAHRHLVEYGTGTRHNKRGAHRGKMPAKPFMGPAEQANDAKYNQKVRELVDRDKTI